MNFGLSRTSATHSKKSGTTGNPPNMSVEDKHRINIGLPLEEKNKKESPQQKPKLTANPGRPIGTTNKAKQEQKLKFIDMKNDIALAWSQLKDLPIHQKPNLVDIIITKAR
jgi:hypothetical protein